MVDRFLETRPAPVIKGVGCPVDDAHHETVVELQTAACMIENGHAGAGSAARWLVETT